MNILPYVRSYVKKYVHVNVALRNSYKNIMCSYEKETARLGGISLGFAGIPPRRYENFPYEHA